MKYDQVFDIIGSTPHVKVSCPELRSVSVYVKLEGQNPTGSIKDRTCISLLRDAMARGDLKPGKIVLDASSGNLACALACHARKLGYEAWVVCSSKLTAEKRGFIRQYGAKLRLVGDFTIQGNEYCRELVTEDPNRFCFLDQLHNWSNPKAHFETTGPEIMADFPDLAMLVGSLGSGGSLLGMGQFIKRHTPKAKIMAVQSAPGTRLPGTASLEEGDYVTPFIDKGYGEGIFEETYKVTEAQAIAGALRLRDQGIFCGIQTGGVLHAAISTAKEQKLNGNIVVVSGDSGWKNMEKLLKAQGADDEEHAMCQKA